jgi:hypothetical protein
MEPSNPVGSRIEIYLNNDTQAVLVGKAHEQIQIVEVVFAAAGLSRPPVDPGLNRVKTNCFDLV